jgi:hypothetical protein
MSPENANMNVVMLVEGFPRLGFSSFASMIADGTSGVCITRLHPDYVMEKFGLLAPKYYWLSGSKGDNVLSPKTLTALMKAVKQEAKEKKVIFFLDGLEYLLLWNDMRKLLSTLEEINQVLKINGGVMYVSIDPLTLEQKDLDRLWAVFPKMQLTEEGVKQAQRSGQCDPENQGRITGGQCQTKALTASM